MTRCHLRSVIWPCFAEMCLESNACLYTHYIRNNWITHKTKSFFLARSMSFPVEFVFPRFLLCCCTVRQFALTKHPVDAVPHAWIHETAIYQIRPFGLSSTVLSTQNGSNSPGVRLRSFMSPTAWSNCRHRGFWMGINESSQIFIH